MAVCWTSIYPSPCFGCEKRPCGTTCEKVAAWHDKIEGLKSAEREGLQQARDAEHLLRRAR